MNRVVISCFDKTTNMVKPWAEAGYTCYCVDIQHAPGETIHHNIIKIGVDILEWLPPRVEPVITFFAPPCTDLAVSGARWFKEKGLTALINGLKLVSKSIQIAEWYNCPWAIENPVSTVSTYWRKPDHIFQPWEYGDLYTKKTCLWVGNGFKMPPPYYKEKPEGVTEKIWLMGPSSNRGDLRGETPMGFAKAVYERNKI